MLLFFIFFIQIDGSFGSEFSHRFTQMQSEDVSKDTSSVFFYSINDQIPFITGVSVNETKLHKADVDSNYLFLNKLIFKAKAESDSLLAARTYLKLGDRKIIEGSYVHGVSYYDSAKVLAQEISNPVLMASYFNGMGIVYSILGEVEQAKKYYLKAFRLNDTLSKDLGVAEILLLNLSSIAIFTGDFQQTINYLSDIETENLQPYPQIKIQQFNNLGIAYSGLSKPDSALLYYNQALELVREHRIIVQEPYISHDVGSIYFNKRDYDRSEETYRYILNKSIRNEIPLGVYYGNIGLGRLSAYKGESEKAYNYFSNALNSAKLIKSFRKQAEVYRELYRLYRDINAEKSLEYYEAYSNHMTKIHKNELDNLRIINTTLFDLKWKEKENELKGIKENEAADGINTLRLYGFVIVFTLITTFILLFVLIILFRSQREANQLLEEQKQVISVNNQALKELNNELKATNTLKDRLLSIISHDIRGPLRSFKSLIQLYRSNAITEGELKMYILKLDDDLSQVLDFTDNLLAWAKSQLKGMVMNKQSINLNRICKEAMELLKPLSQDKKISLKLTEKEKEINAFADKDMVSLIIRNILSNAIKFTHTNGLINLNISVEDKKCKITISDSGIGMSEKQIEKFKANKLSSSAGTNNEKGMGLGLLLSKSFVEMHSGEIQIESLVNKGTSFIVILPL